MRFIPVNFLKEGLIVGNTLCYPNGGLLVCKNHRLTKEDIEIIKRYKFTGVFIEDELSNHMQDLEEMKTNVKMQASSLLKGIIHKQILNPPKEAMQLRGKDIKELEYIVNKICEKCNVNLMDVRSFDIYTFEHSINVCILSLSMGLLLSLSENNLYDLGVGSILHDIGKTFIPSSIINKPGSLTAEEMSSVKEHPRLGYEYLRRYINIPKASVSAILDHHERMDGSGYLLGRKGQDIPLYGRIVAIVDVYDALTTERSYKKAFSHVDAIKIIKEGAKTLFDENLVALFEAQTRL